MTSRAPGLLFPLLAMAPALAAQDFVLSLDARMQRVDYRGVEKDSIPLAQVVTGPSGGPQTPDGYAVTCVPGQVWCVFYRAGPVLLGAPLMTTADLSAWGFGVRGLSVHASARLGVNLGSAETWPGTAPAVQLLEGYAEYASERLTGRVGRLVERGRLGYEGFDGIRLAYRMPSVGLTAIGYGGFGLARGVALPVTSDALNPLDDFQPRLRQYLAGGALEWQGSSGDARLDYEREVDQDTRNWVSERVALSGSLRPVAGWSLTGGAEYDLARGWWGSADLTVTHSARKWGGSAGVRRYRPFFDLWTIWGVFSPLPYSAVTGSIWISPVSGLTLRGGGERYWYPDAEAETPLVDEETEGWRWNIGGTYAISSTISVDAGYHTAFGPGASSKGLDAGLGVQLRPDISLTVEAGHLDRPLEFRAEDPALTWYGLTVDFRPNDRLRLGLGATRYDENRARPDASTIDWSQTRLRAAVSWLFGSSPDRLLPPGVRREGRR